MGQRECSTTADNAISSNHNTRSSRQRSLWRNAGNAPSA